MMPNSSTTKTARQTLGETLKFYREQRGFNHARVADITKASRSDVEAWEEGRLIPTGHQWELLKKMVHRGLGQVANVRLSALAEENAERALAQRAEQRPSKPVTEPLTTRPFEVLAKKPILSVVPDPPKPAQPVPPAPAPAPTPEPVPAREVPATLIGETFDLTDAYTTVNALPRGWGTAEAREARSALAKDLILKGLDTEDIVKQVRAKFGVGISRVTLKALREEIAKEAAKAARKALRDAVKPMDINLEPAPVPVPPEPTPTPAPPPASAQSDSDLVDYARGLLGKSPYVKVDDLVTQLTQKFGRSLSSHLLHTLCSEAKASWVAKNMTTPGTSPKETQPSPNEKDIETAAHLVLDIIPNLKTFTIEVNDLGEVTVSHTVREVRVIESTASIKMKR